MVSDTDPIQSRAPRMEVHCPATLRRAWGQVSGESVSAGVFHASVARVRANVESVTGGPLVSQE